MMKNPSRVGNPPCVIFRRHFPFARGSKRSLGGQAGKREATRSRRFQSGLPRTGPRARKFVICRIWAARLSAVSTASALMFRRCYRPAIVETVLSTKATIARYRGSALLQRDKITVGTTSTATTVLGAPSIRICASRAPKDRGQSQSNPSNKQGAHPHLPI
jgi:hypothetical protein